MADKTEQEQRETVKKLVKDARIAMLTTMTGDGRHVSRPMALQDVEFDGDLWFFAYADSDLVAQVGTEPLDDPGRVLAAPTAGRRGARAGDRSI